MRKKIILFLTVFLVITLAGCGGNKAQEPAKSKVSQVVRYNVCTEPETLDPAISTGMPEGTILTNMFDGLVRYGPNNEIKPGIAKEWSISPDGLVYTFKLREAKWSNGDPVTARDFVYSWLRALDPKTASEYAYQLYYIKGAEEYNSDKGKREDVAVKARDDLTLEVTLRAPAPQFLGLTAFPVLFPVNPRVDQENTDWPKVMEKYVVNGPFKPVKWEHNQKIELVKNDKYWDAQNVKLEKLEIYLIDNIDTGYNMYKTGQLEFQDEVPTQELAQLKAKNEVKIFPDASVYFYRFNVTKKPFNDPRVRRALAMAVNRQELVDKVTQAGQLPAFAFVPFGFTDADGKDFRQNGGNQFFKEDVAEARRLLAEAGYPDGKGFPRVNILTNTHAGHQKLAQAIQQMWKQNLGVEVGVLNQEWKVYLDAQDTMNYDILRSGWSPDYLDPMSFIDMFVTKGGNNDTGWSNKEYDALVAKANSTGDQKVRMEAMHQAESILMKEMPVMPLYFYTNPNLIKDNLKGVLVPPFAVYADFKNAYLE
ncbi:MAG: peptide ABC transporter substrate-binding protein [Bacillota bacterium]